MKVSYDPSQDVLQILFSNEPVEKTSEDKPGLILDYDRAGQLVGLELRSASKRIGQKETFWSFEFEPEPTAKSKVPAIKAGALDWERATAEEIIADLRSTRVEQSITA